jgi:hypothetical protein
VDLICGQNYDRSRRPRRPCQREDSLGCGGAGANAESLALQKRFLRKIGLPPVVANAIQEKLHREQEAEQMKFIVQKKSQEAERKRIEAQHTRCFAVLIDFGRDQKETECQ